MAKGKIQILILVAGKLGFICDINAASKDESITENMKIQFAAPR